MQKIALIPARKGSKRFPNKNVAKIGNRTLIEIAIEQAIQSELFNEIIVSTDDEMVKDIARPFNITIHDRDPQFAKSDSTLIEMIQSLIREFDFRPEYVITLLMVTAPLRKVEDIKTAVTKFIDSKKINSVVSVVENEYPYQLLWEKRNEKLNYVFEEALQSTRKQNYQTTYKFNDALVVDSAENFLITNRNLFGLSPIPYIMEPERSIYIDYEWQFKLIEKLLDN